MSGPSPAGAARRGTRWGPAILTAVIGLALIGSMAEATINNVFGFEANLRIINSNTSDTNLNGFSISSGQIHAVDAGFGIAPVHQADGTWKNVLRAGFANAQITGLCLSKTESVGLLGTYTLKLISPSSQGAISANNGVFDITDLVGNSDGQGINLKGSTQIGLSTADITTVFANGAGLPYQAMPFGTSSSDSPLDVWTTGVEQGTPPATSSDGKSHVFGGGWTGIDAGAADLYRVAGRLWQVQLTGAITLPGLKITVTQGSSPCADWPGGPPYTNSKPFP